MEIKKEEFYSYCQTLTGIEITDETEIFYDFGWEGLDTDMFMITLTDKFSVNLEAYNHDEYDHGDTNLLTISFSPIDRFVLLLLRIFNKKLWKKYRKRWRRPKTFTALHLYEVVRCGKWFEPELAY